MIFRILPNIGIYQLTAEMRIYLLVITAAKNRRQLNDLFLLGRLSRELELGYLAIRRVADFLIEQGLVEVEDGRLRLGTLVRFDLLESELGVGSLEAWEIVDAFPARSRKYEPDNDLLAQIGLLGELHVIQELRSELPESEQDKILHTSLFDDSAGFDIASPSIMNPSQRVHLEVKTSTRPGNRFVFYLSRNEFEKAIQLNNWFLVLVKIDNGQATLFGYLEASSLKGYFPLDIAESFSWTVSKGAFSQDDLRRGLP